MGALTFVLLFFNSFFLLKLIVACRLFVLSGWGKIMIPMFRLWLHSLYGLYGPRCLLSPERPLNLVTHSITHFRTLLANFCFVIYQNHIIHVIIVFKHDVLCIVRSEAWRGQEDQSVHEARSTVECSDITNWPLHAADLTMHGTSCLNP